MISFHLFLAQVCEQCHVWWDRDRDIPDGQSPEAVPNVVCPGAEGSQGLSPAPEQSRRSSCVALMLWVRGQAAALSSDQVFSGCCGRFPSLVILLSLTLV